MDIKQDKQKILFLVTKSNWGGAQKYVHDLATNLPKESYESKVILGGAGTLKDKLEAKHIGVIQLKELERDVNLIKEIKVFLT